MDPVITPIAVAVGAVGSALAMYFKNRGVSKNGNGNGKVCSHHEALCQKVDATDENVRDIQTRTTTIMQSTARIEGLIEGMKRD